METEDGIQITRRQFGKLAQLLTGKTHHVQVKTRYTCHMLEVEDVNFHHDSAVLLPDYGPFTSQEGTTKEQERVTGLAVLYACYRHVREHPDQAALVVGHTDRSGSDAYNQTLSEMRADGVLAALQGERGAWVSIAEGKSKVEDYQQILIWLTRSLGWNCDPGKKDNVHGSKTQQAVEDFQDQYEKKFKATIPPEERGKVGSATWGAFFDVYMQELQFALGTDEAGLREAQQSVRFTGCGAIGCGERHPITPNRKANYKTPVDRRVEILFFDPGEEPLSGDDCTKPESTCQELYKDGCYKVTPVPVEPLPVPSGLAVHVMLEVLYKDPEDPDTKQRAFPEGFSVTIAYADGTHEEKTLGKDGTLEFFALREKKAFTLRFETDPPQYIARPSPHQGPGGPDEVITEDAVQEKQRQGYQMFMLPVQTWGLADSWDVSGAPTYNAASHQFEGLEDTSLTKIGSAAKPATLVLDPHWQYLKFVYYDRLLKATLRLPPLMIEGAADEVLLDLSTPDTRSSWSIDQPHGCQCLPWILQDPPMPRKDTVIQFRTAENTFIESFDNGARRLVKVKPEEDTGLINPFEDDPDPDVPEPEIPPDPGLNLGQEVTFAIGTPSPDRLRFYDLPPVWKSRGYHARLLKGPSSNEAAKRGTFEELIKETTTPEAPLMFSLDDIVLMQFDFDAPTLRMEMVELDPDERVTVFSHTFKEDDSQNVALYGVYDAEDDAYFLTKKPSVSTPGYYIADYPDWTRLVLAQGALFDVFDRRTPDESHFDVVGARAALRLSSSSRRRPGQTANPSTRKRGFTVLTEFYEQRHDKWYTPASPNDDRGIGRFDMAMLRCCDVVDGREVALNFQYYRFFFDFSDDDLGDLHTDPDEQKAWGHEAVKNIAKRWNGPDGSFNTDPALILPQDPAQEEPKDDPARKLRVHVLWFPQVMPDVNQAHFEVKVKDDVRASMGSFRGTGKMEPDDHEPSDDDDSKGYFVAAHESGHAGSMGDEYIERFKTASYYQPGFYTFSPGAPYYPDERGMMRGDYDIRTRYFWHVAEWVRSLDDDKGFFVQQGAFNYTLPHHTDAPEKSYVNFPLANRKDVARGARGLFDWVLCPLGADQYSQNGLIDGHTLDGILAVIVKMKFTFHSDDYDDLRRAVYNIRRTLAKKLNRRWYVTGEFNTPGAANYRKFEKCLLEFSPRFLVTNFPDDEEDAERYAKKVRVRRPEDLDDDFDLEDSKEAYEDKVQDLESDHGKHFDVLVDKAFWSSETAWEAQRTLRITCSDRSWYREVDDLLLDEFPAMLGINKKADALTPADVLPIAQITGDLLPPTPILNNADVKEL